MLRLFNSTVSRGDFVNSVRNACVVVGVNSKHTTCHLKAQVTALI